MKMNNAGYIFLFDHNKYPAQIRIAVEGMKDWTADQWMFQAEDMLVALVNDDIKNYTANDWWEIEEADLEIESYGGLSV
jgi:hypothetical protein